MVKPWISPLRWTPPPIVAAAEPAGTHVTRVIEVGHAPEDVLVDHDGTIITGLDDGRILRVDAQTHVVTELCRIDGRPFGIEHHPQGGFVVCGGTDLLWWRDGSVTTLASGFVFCNNAAVAADGTIYFTDSTTKFGKDEWKGDLLEHRPTGRLLRYRDGEVETLLGGLAFANGVALTADEKTVIVAETGAYRLNAYDIESDTSTFFVESLPGFPDNIARGDDGLIWVALASPRDKTLDFLLPRPPVVRQIVWQLPDFLQPQPQQTIHVRAYRESGELVHDLSGSDPRFGMVTGVRRVGDEIWLGSLTSSSIACLQLSP